MAWDIGRTWTRAEVAALLAAHRAPFFTGDTATLTRLGQGWDNTAWQITHGAERWAVRLPRHDDAAALLSNEISALHHIAPLLPTPISAPRWHTRLESGWPIAAYPHLAGEPLLDAPLSPTEAPRIARALGAALATLHAIPASHAPALAALPHVEPRAALVPRWAAQIRTYLDRLHHEPAAGAHRLSADDDARAHQLLARAEAEATAAAPAPCLTHGDLGARHLLTHRGPTGRVLAGIIDWGDLEWGPSEADLGVAFAQFEGRALHAFLAAYPPLCAPTITRACVHALRKELILLLWSLEIENTAQVHASRAALTRLVRLNPQRLLEDFDAARPSPA